MKLKGFPVKGPRGKGGCAADTPMGAPSRTVGGIRVTSHSGRGNAHSEDANDFRDTGLYAFPYTTRDH
ncbi:hypothetical protein E4U57_005695 [Claviceps arundinis]|uniref:Uncharacterized protein n=1 Tax=Claviceps arundinis TaxID=1623583 RepID=A0A9P7MN37_9HYPO|nr:hypothetical protein E4U57_005695 [Claviceps arundinis]KAG5962522.1 hypothetical protein E4U56_003309 [Claviceps arundinis]